jgi:hypothetical protein
VRYVFDESERGKRCARHPVEFVDVLLAHPSRVRSVLTYVFLLLHRCLFGRRTISNDSPTGAKTRCLIFEDHGVPGEPVLIVAFRGSVGEMCCPRSDNWTQNFNFKLSSMSDISSEAGPDAKAHRGFQTVRGFACIAWLASLRVRPALASPCIDVRRFCVLSPVPSAVQLL